MPGYEHILLAVSDHVATLTLNRPERRNAVGPQMIAEALNALEAWARDDDVRVLALTGAGKVFCAGGDLGRMAGGGGESGGGGAASGSASDAPAGGPPRGFADLLIGLRSFPKPTVAVVNGHAMAGGLGLVAACDFAVASDAAEFATPEIDRGLFPMMIAAAVLRVVPRRKAMELFCLGGRRTAAEAEQMGLISRAVPAAQLEAAAREFCLGLATKSPAVLRLGIAALARQEGMPFAEAVRYLETMLGRVFETEDCREGLSAFMEKRAPVWKGR